MQSLNQVLDGFSARAAFGPLHPFTFKPHGGVSPREVEKLLTERGIRVVERVRMSRHELGFSVPVAQAEWAEYLLCRAGVRVTSDLIDPRHAHLNAVTLRSHAGLLDRLVGAIADFTAP
jgi:hypothetical protein